MIKVFLGLFILALGVIIITAVSAPVIQNLKSSTTESGISPSQTSDDSNDMNIGETSVDNTDGNRYVAQVFKAAKNTVTGVNLKVKRGNSTVTKDLNVSIWSVDAAFAPDALLQQKTLLATTVSATTSTEYNIAFELPVTVGTLYAIVADYNDAKALDGNYYVVRARKTNAYADGNMYGSFNGTDWYEIDANTRDMYFSVNYETRQSLVPSTTLPLLDMPFVILVGALLVFIIVYFIKMRE